MHIKLSSLKFITVMYYSTVKSTPSFTQGAIYFSNQLPRRYFERRNLGHVSTGA